jgi:hypothetical protein
MRSHKQFRRYKGTIPPGGVAIGTDLVASLKESSDNATSSRGLSQSGNAVVRLSAVWHPSADEGITTLSGVIWQYDHATEKWFATSAAQTMTQNRVVHFPIVVPTDGMIGRDFQNQGGGGLLAALVTDGPGGLVGTEHLFSLTFDLSYG